MPLFPDRFIQEVADKTDIYDIVSQYVALKKAGGSYIGLCPFHSEKTPSFSVSPRKGIFHCFGCGVGGNAITFLMKIENLSFQEAVVQLAERAGIAVPELRSGEDKAARQRRADERERLYAVNLAAAQYFYSSIKDSPAAVAYLKGRGLTGADAKRFFLGYAKEGWDNLFSFLKGQGYVESDIQKAGLITMNESGNVYDRFRNRIMFPIFDTRDHIIGFGGRVLDDSKPKYLNSPEGPLFSKSRNLFGLNIARRAHEELVILVEGYMDAIALMRCGYSNTVATLGTALTTEQAQLLKRYFSEVVICYDSDAAGRKATERAIGVLREAGCTISVLDLKAKKDPDEYLQAYGRERFDRCLQERKPDMAYVMDYYGESYDVNDTAGKIAYIGALTPYLSAISDQVELDVYINALSGRTGVSPDAIYAQVGVRRAEGARHMPQQHVDMDRLVRQQDRSKLDNARDALLCLLASDRTAYMGCKPRLFDGLFGSGARLALYRAICSAYDSGGVFDMAAYPMQEEYAGEWTRILSGNSEYDDIQKAVADFLKVIAQELRRDNAYQAMRTGQQDGDLEKLNQILQAKGIKRTEQSAGKE